MLVEFNQSDADFPHEPLIHQRFEAQVQANPAATALVFEEQTLSYGELNARANLLAQYLIEQGELNNYSMANIFAAALGLTSRHLAYLIYTSGATGQPKGVMIEHQSFVNRTGWMQRYFGLGPQSRLLHTFAFVSDLSAYQLLGTQMCGASLVLPKPAAHKDPQQIGALIRRHQVTQIHFVPAMLSILLEQLDFATLPSRQQVLVGGDTVIAALVQRFHQADTQAVLYNTYRPAECTIDISYWRADPQAFDGNVSIGRPIDNLHCYVLGDQVKVCGLCIELGEIEAQLHTLPAAQEAVVISQPVEQGESQLVAYLVAEPAQTLAVDAVRAELHPLLPDYLVPAFFVALESIPLTSNGKVDRKALPALAVSDLAQSAYVAPRGETEVILASIWQDLLNVERVGRHDNYFHLGGHSLLIIRLMAALQAQNLCLDSQLVFQQPTLHSLAATLKPLATTDLFRASANRTPEHCQCIAPELLPLVTLTQAQIELITNQVPIGVDLAGVAER